MRQVISGYLQDSTAAAQAYLQTAQQLTLPNLYLIGYPEDPNALWLTDWESPIWWPCWGSSAYLPANISRGAVPSKTGLDVDTLDLTYTPSYVTYGLTTATANVWQAAQQGLYDNIPVRVWTCYLLPGGDAMTLGCSTCFGGRIGRAKVDRGKIVFTVNSFLDVVNQQLPPNTIEMYSQTAAYSGATPPAGFSIIPQFNVERGASTTVVVGDCTNIGPHHIFGTNVLRGGYLVFNPGSTLGPTSWSAIQQNVEVNIGGNNYNQFVLYAPLLFPPTFPGDTFYVSAPSPNGGTEENGFLFLPAPAIGGS